MKKIDLHVHTVPTISDCHFEFDIHKLKEYVKLANLAAIAITNHNIFDLLQFEEIRQNLDIKVFPGIEIDLEKGHLLVISDGDLTDFGIKCAEVTTKIKTKYDFISIAEFKNIFGDLNQFLLIPHYDKSPKLPDEIIEKLKDHISAGEVQSQKKFIYCQKDDRKLVPVIFSDCRIEETMTDIPIRQTFIDCGEVTLTSLKQCLKDKSKVALSEKDGNRLFQIFDNGQYLSTGLNVIVGERSSGKSYTLEKINSKMDSIKFIRQFSLLQQDDANDEKKFVTTQVDRLKVFRPKV
jgi:hypothetical protein